MNYKFEVKGRVVPKGRPRVTKRGITYTPERTKEYEELVKYSFLSKYRNVEPSTKEFKARIVAYFEVPKSYSKKKREMLLPIEGITCSGAGYKGKLDLDNIAKSILDALNNVVYVDDSQVTLLLVYKLYGEEAKVEVELEEIGEFI
jgi:Holliday junction resolvase RusA-like endonuclease